MMINRYIVATIRHAVTLNISSKEPTWITSEIVMPRDDKRQEITHPTKDEHEASAAVRPN